MKILRSKWILPVLFAVWTAWDTIGSVEKVHSNQFTNYLESITLGSDNLFFAGIGESPQFALICISIVSLFILLFYTVSDYIIKMESMSIFIKYTIVAIWLICIVFNIIIIFDNFLELMRWKFYISAFAGIPIICCYALILIHFYCDLKHSKN